MDFKVASTVGAGDGDELPRVLLVEDQWDDWFQFSTMYTVYVFDSGGTRHQIGSVKIGQFDMPSDQRRPALENEFESLDDRFFSLGQDDSYYDHLNELVPDLKDEILNSLRDLPYGESDRFEAALEERVTTVSLLRSVAKGSVRDQFRRMALGGVRLSQYHFSYSGAAIGKSKKAAASFSFDVQPDSQPPTNIHVIIGRNGVGKTHLLNAMSRALVRMPDEEIDNGRFDFPDEEPGTGLFANFVSVTFSAFDPFEPISASQSRKAGVEYSYIGLKRVAKPGEDRPLAPKSPQMLSREFTESAKICRQGARAGRWLRALKMLESDPIFKDAQVASLAPSDEEGGSEVGPSTNDIFSRLSSGHKIVLLTITRLVETVAERTLVLLDEPEAHLHPPLLSAFIRALSDLLVNRNGVAIVATHSPVILQEVPKSCVWKLRRSGLISVAERPEIETFGENVGILTREVFGLEVTDSGFHRLLSESVTGRRTYEQVLTQFNGELGGEARAIVMGLLAVRDEDEL
jgi:predicted ATPase